PERHRRLIFGRAVAGERRVVAVELDDDMAGAGRLLRLLVAPGADDEFRAVLLEGDGVGGNVILVSFGIGYIDHRDPVAFFRHLVLPHGFQRKKLAIRARPSAWLFSGWNWVPALLSFATAAVTGPP